MQVSPDGNQTNSILTFQPTLLDHDKVITCRAENPKIQRGIAEDTWKLNVFCKYAFSFIDTNEENYTQAMKIKDLSVIFIESRDCSIKRMFNMFWCAICFVLHLLIITIITWCMRFVEYYSRRHITVCIIRIITMHCIYDISTDSIKKNWTRISNHKPIARGRPRVYILVMTIWYALRSRHYHHWYYYSLTHRRQYYTSTPTMLQIQHYYTTITRDHFSPLCLAAQQKQRSKEYFSAYNKRSVFAFYFYTTMKVNTGLIGNEIVTCTANISMLS